MKKLLIAAQIYSVREEAEHDLLAVLKQIKEIGYDGVELAGFYNHSPAEVKAMLTETGLTPISAHVSMHEWADDPAKTADTYRDIGCGYAAVPYLSETQRPGGAEYPQTLELIREIGRLCNERGMTLLYHNHDFEFITLPSGRRGLDELFLDVPAELLQTELDTCWASVAGVDPVSYLRKYSGRSPLVHLKDYTGEKAENMYGLLDTEPKAVKRPSHFQFRAVGDGCQDWKAIWQACLDAGAEWVVVEQDEHEEYSPMEDMRRSLVFLRSLDR